MPRSLLLWMLLVGLALLACGRAATARRTEPPVTPALWPDEVHRPNPSHPTKHLVLCLPAEPPDLFWTQSNHEARLVLETLLEPLIDSRQYEYQANLVERLPSFDQGDATLREVVIGEGNRFFDALSQQPKVLTVEAATEPFALYQLDGSIRSFGPGGDGWEPGMLLPTVQLTAAWTLVEELTWEDGTPVSAADSLFHFEQTLDPHWHGSTFLTERTAAYRAQGRTLIWEGLPGYLDDTYFLNVWPPLPRHALALGQQRYDELSVAQLRFSTAANRAPLSYGPYRIAAWLPGERIELVPNEHYGRGRPPLDRLTFRFVPDPAERIALLLRGACDVLTRAPDLEAHVTELRALAEAGRLVLQQVPGPLFEHLDFNLRPAPDYQGAAATLLASDGTPLLQKKEFRQAVAACLDRQTLMAQSTGGAAFVRDSYLPATHLLYPGDSAIRRYPFNPMHGRELLASVGWHHNDADGWSYNAAGQRLTLRYALRRSPQREQLARLIQDQLRLYCGIELEIDAYGAEFFDNGPDGPIFGRRYDLAQFGWLSGIEPACHLYQSTLISDPTTGALVPVEEWDSNNNTGFANPDFNTACTLALQSLDDDDRAAYHAEALRLFTEELPSLPLFARSLLLVHRPEVTGVQLDPTAATELWNVEQFDVE